MFYGNLAQLGKKSNSVIRSRSVMVKNWCNVLSMEGVTVCGHHKSICRPIVVSMINGSYCCRDVEIFLDMPVILTDFENLVSPNNKNMKQKYQFFVRPNEILSVKSFGLTLFNITAVVAGGV